MLKEHLVDYDADSGRMRHTPRQVFVETSSRCNLTCVHCPVDFGREDGPAKLDMPEETIRRIAPWLTQAHFVNLNFIGEPLLSPHFPLLIETCARGSAEVSFNSNGLLLNEKTCVQLVESRVHSVAISVDGIQSMPAIRGVPYEAVRRGILKLHEVKERMGSELPHIALAYVMMRRNAYELPKVLRDLLPRAAIHSVHVQPLVVLYETLRGENPYRDAHTPDALAEARAVADQHSTTLITFRSQDAGDERYGKETRDRAQLGQVSEQLGCVDPFYEIKVRSTGDIYACSYGRYPDLNVHELELDEIWNHDWYRRLRRNLHAKRFEDRCENCPCVFGSADNQEDSLRVGVQHSRAERFHAGYRRRLAGDRPGAEPVANAGFAPDRSKPNGSAAPAFRPAQDPPGS